MNFLAHIYLSGDSREILIGNFIGDYVKGKKIAGYPEEVKRGIMLHRNIDSFTDTHTITRSSKKIIAGKYGLYAGIVVDISFKPVTLNKVREPAFDPGREYGKPGIQQPVSVMDIIVKRHI